ncbi:ATP-binding cassette domain-containing protein [Gordonia shandongensis]|uniref:ATP-binding cassette domain-containing protein n=1 Tax=Gordonia shandongensis TaxID=376351 RepID=UPI00042687D0|nr:ATP-binding cassette domain-containing protein [Gordonia shandongensis]
MSSSSEHLSSHEPPDGRAAVVLQNVHFAWPDGTAVLDGVTASFGVGRTGLVGRNGSGKSTLLRLVAGDLAPASGRIVVTGDVGRLRQDVTRRPAATVADLLGVGDTVAALRAIEGGATDERHFETVGDDWDIEARATATLDRAGLTGRPLDSPVTGLSGGEAMIVAVAGLHLRRHAITLLDEPTNNLDRDARARVAALIDEWPGTLIVVSHDLDLLDTLDHTAELHRGRLETFGGPYGRWREHVEREQRAAMAAATSAQQALVAQKRRRVTAETTLARRARTARRTARDGGIPAVLAGRRAEKAQGSAAQLRATHDRKVGEAQAAVDAADARVRDDDHISVDLPDPGVPSRRRIAELAAADQPAAEHAAAGRSDEPSTPRIVLQGPQRLALIGPNGAGKSTLLARLRAGIPATADRPGGRLFTDRVGYLPQRLDALDDAASALENVRAAAPDADPGDIRNRLARLLLRGDSVDRPVAELSGGERFRASLATLLFAEPPAALLILDEPTNDLDVSSVEHLTEALNAYRGALIVVSHDHRFLDGIGIDTVVALDAAGRLHRLPEVPR